MDWVTVESSCGISPDGSAVILVGTSTIWDMDSAVRGSIRLLDNLIWGWVRDLSWNVADSSGSSPNLFTSSGIRKRWLSLSSSVRGMIGRLHILLRCLWYTLKANRDTVKQMLIHYLTETHLDTFWKWCLKTWSRIGCSVEHMCHLPGHFQKIDHGE